MFHRISILVGLYQFFAYIALSTLVEYWFYYKSAKQYQQWKCNARLIDRLIDGSEDVQKSTNQSINQSTHGNHCQSIKHFVTNVWSWPLLLLIKQIIEKFSNQSKDQSNPEIRNKSNHIESNNRIHKKTISCDSNDSTNQSNNQTIKQAINSTTNQSIRQSRHPYHSILATVNLSVSALCASIVTECYVRGHSSLDQSIIQTINQSIDRTIDQSINQTINQSIIIIFFAFLSLLWQNVIEYYWHRFMHAPVMYKMVHKLHHFYKAPQPFDDMMIHPLEAFGYYCILYSPAFVIKQPLESFLLYMSVLGLCGVLDHCGVKMNLSINQVFKQSKNQSSKQSHDNQSNNQSINQTIDQSINQTIKQTINQSFELFSYDTEFHDLHHRMFNVNYGFHWPLMDIIHGTAFNP